MLNLAFNMLYDGTCPAAHGSTGRRAWAGCVGEKWREKVQNVVTDIAVDPQRGNDESSCYFSLSFAGLDVMLRSSG